jgi:hypothetical protein
MDQPRGPGGLRGLSDQVLPTLPSSTRVANLFPLHTTKIENLFDTSFPGISQFVSAQFSGTHFCSFSPFVLRQFAGTHMHGQKKSTYSAE